MNPDDWVVERRLRNGGLRIRHMPTRAVFEVWVDEKEVMALLRQGAAGSSLFEEAKQWFLGFGMDQAQLL
jgi:hypothetical protein